MNRYISLCKKLSAYLLTISAIGLVIITAIISWQIFDRYVFNSTPDWSQKLAILIMTFVVMLMIAVGVHEDFHLSLIFFKNITKGKVRKTIDGVIFLLIGFFSVAMFYYGILLMKQTWTHIMPALNIPSAFAFLPLPLGSIFILIFIIEQFFLIYKRKED